MRALLAQSVFPYLVLLRAGFTLPPSVTTDAVRSYRTISPLPVFLRKLRRFLFCCTFRGLTSPRRYLALCPWSPDFPPRPCGRSDCLADSVANAARKARHSQLVFYVMNRAPCHGTGLCDGRDSVPPPSRDNRKAWFSIVFAAAVARRDASMRPNEDEKRATALIMSPRSLRARNGVGRHRHKRVTRRIGCGWRCGQSSKTKVSTRCRSKSLGDDAHAEKMKWAVVGLELSLRSPTS